MMYAAVMLPAWAGLAVAIAQAPPPPVLLSTTQSGVLPVLPTPFSGVETIEGAITYDGPPVAGFTGPGGDADVQSGLPAATYQAILPSTNFDNLTGSIITGTITGTSVANGTGVLFSVNFNGFPSEAAYGPFVYHIHALAVPADGNCSATLGHLDPTDRGELYACDVGAPETCQAGDLAGKHGNITSYSFAASYTDLYLSTDPSSPYFFGDKSVVVHTTNTTRLTCANFMLVSNSSASTSSATNSSAINSSSGATINPYGTGIGTGFLAGPSSAMTATPIPYLGAAAHVSSAEVICTVGGVLAVIAAFFL